MGSVRDLYTTGDNDPEIYPVQYYRHYLYCDACGSFELEHWTAPDDGKAIETWRRRLSAAALYLSPLALVAGLQALGFSPWWVLVAALAVVAGLLVASQRLSEKIEVVGMRCKPCGATYAHGTPFFTDLDANPRDLTVADVPRPLGVSPFLEGKSVESEASPG